MIEVLNGVFYNPELPWYEQPQELIDLGLEVEQTKPYYADVESLNGRVRYTLLKWFHATEKGTFEFQVSMEYLYPISANNFLTKSRHNNVKLTKLSDEQL